MGVNPTRFNREEALKAHSTKGETVDGYLGDAKDYHLGERCKQHHLLTKEENFERLWGGERR